MADKSVHEIVAEKEARGEHGHFVKKPAQSSPPAMNHEPSVMNPLSKILNTSSISHKDDLVDLHIGNPLRRIALLLENIKKQKTLFKELFDSVLDKSMKGEMDN